MPASSAPPSPFAAERAPGTALAGAGARQLAPLIPMLAALAVSILFSVSIMLGRMPGSNLVVIWLPNALAAGLWLRFGKGRSGNATFAGALSVGIMAGELIGGNSPLLAISLALVNLAEIAIAVGAVRRLAPGARVDTVRGTLCILAATTGVACLVGAVAGAAVFSVMRDMAFLAGFQLWWFGHALGMAIVLPLILSIDRTAPAVWRKPLRLAEWSGLLGVFGAAVGVHYFVAGASIGFVLNILLAVIAARLRVVGVSVALLIATMALFGSLLHGNVPTSIVGVDASGRLVASQLIMLSIALPFLLIAALLQERDRLIHRATAGQRRAELASEAKSRLLANVAHEIKSPVAGVIGIGELWAGGQLGATTPQQAEMADMLVKTARQVETLAHDLLDVARAEAGRVDVSLTAVDVPALVEDVRRQVQLRPESAGVRFGREVEEGPLVARADSVRLAQIVSNLASNAVKYGGAGGEVTFRVMRDIDRIRIEVADRGPGLTAEKQLQLFEPFNRLGLERSTIEGHGIGLALAKRLTELMGGQIGVNSAPGDGAVFWVELPAA